LKKGRPWAPNTAFLDREKLDKHWYGVGKVNVVVGQYYINVNPSMEGNGGEWRGMYGMEGNCIILMLIPVNPSMEGVGDRRVWSCWWEKYAYKRAASYRAVEVGRYPTSAQKQCCSEGM